MLTHGHAAGRRATVDSAADRTVAGPWSHVAVLVPCRDEERTVARVVRDFRAALPGCRVLVCDNGSADATTAVAAAAGAVVVREPRPGKGRALRRLLAAADAQVYVLVDGDGTYDAAAAPALVRTLAEQGLDMVVAARVPRTEAALSRPGHRLGNALVSQLVRSSCGGGLTDVLSGYRVLSRELADGLPWRAAGFDVEVEVTACALLRRAWCAEVPTAYAERPAGSVSKLRTGRDGLRVLARLAVVRAGRRGWSA